ncbi:hypothetical protein DMH25_08110 [Streptomyces sp. WAC 01325]|uniref:hypothetical protein n=1 Tax=Streptomyces sp. WAC 01325 TaxID=2203202 RepID=UPI000F892B7B|nr:hypothetical protein [Streptomyces sp. WAC 01325]RSN13745.1 hypothetical protein DMH25_08110 [Streptomyces sp. WAC 01325]
MGATVTGAASAARTASGNSGELSGFGDWSRFRAQLNVTAASGTTPTLDVVIEDSFDGAVWNQVAAFTQKTATGVQALDVTGMFTDRLRVRWTIGGTTPSFTFDVKLHGKG